MSQTSTGERCEHCGATNDTVCWIASHALTAPGTDGGYLCAVCYCDSGDAPRDIVGAAPLIGRVGYMRRHGARLRVIYDQAGLTRNPLYIEVYAKGNTLLGTVVGRPIPGPWGTIAGREWWAYAKDDHGRDVGWASMNDTDGEPKDPFVGVDSILDYHGLLAPRRRSAAYNLLAEKARAVAIERGVARMPEHFAMDLHHIDRLALEGDTPLIATPFIWALGPTHTILMSADESGQQYLRDILAANCGDKEDRFYWCQSVGNDGADLELAYIGQGVEGLREVTRRLDLMLEQQRIAQEQAEQARIDEESALYYKRMGPAHPAYGETPDNFLHTPLSTEGK